MLINTPAVFSILANDVPVRAGMSVTWDFGDGSVAMNDLTGDQVFTRRHAYAARGTYTVTATISDGVDTTVLTTLVNASEAAMAADPADASRQALVVTGSDANDTIDVYQTTNGRYTVMFNGVNLGTAFNPASRIYVYGNGGSNNITVTGPTDAVVYAGTAGSTVYTGSGNDVIIGSVGVDRLNGNGGRDILIGNAGADVLRGGDGEDIVVAGSITKMNDTTTVLPLSATWTGTGSLAARRQALLPTFSKQLIGDAGGNQLYGEAGNDWLVLNTSADKLKDLQKTDLVN